MANTILEARAVIYGDDKTGPAFTAIEKKIASLGKSAGAIDKVAKSMDRLASSKMVQGMAWANADNVASRSMIDRLNEYSRAADQAASKVSHLHRVVQSAGRAMQQAAPWVAGAAGFAALHATRGALKAGADVQSARAQMSVAGIPGAEISAADAQSAQLAAIYTNVHRSAILDAYKETRSVLLNPDETPGMMPTIIGTKSALDALDKSGHASEGLQFAVKGAEVLGRAQKPEEFNRYMDAFVRAREVMGQMVTPEGIYDLSKYFKASGRGLSDRFITTTGFSLMQELSGSTAGKGVDQFIKQMVGGFQGQQHAAAKEFIALGLAKKSDFLTTRTGEIKGMKPGHHVKGADVAARDPDKWVWDYLVPALDKAGYKTDEQKINQTRRLYPNSNAADLVAKLITQRESFQNHARLYSEAHGITGAQELLKEDPTAALNSLTTSLSNFGATLTSPIMTSAAHMMSSIATEIGQWGAALDQFNKANPTLAKILGGSAVAGGTIGGAAGAYGLLSGMANGFGLKGSAVALDEAAGALDAAAVKLGGGGAVSGVADAAKKGGPLAFLAGTPGLIFGSAVVAAAGLFDLVHNLPTYQDGTPGPHGKYYRPSGLRLPGGGTYDYTLGSKGGFQEYGTHIAPYSSGFHEFTEEQARHVAPTPLGHMDGALKAVVEGPITAELHGSADINIGGRIELSGEASRLLTLATTIAGKSSSDHLKLNTGRSMPEAAPFSRRQ